MTRTSLRLLTTVALAALAVGTVPRAGAAESPEAPLNWVALGDSYTAGVIPPTGAELDPEGAHTGCARTEGSYPRLVAGAWGGRVRLTDVACNNAMLAEIAHQGQVPLGSPRDYLEGRTFKAVAPQLAAVDEDTDLVTVGMGGKDSGFGEVVYACAMQEPPRASDGSPVPCEERTRELVEARLASAVREYDDMLRRIHRKAPHAKILTVGYPSIVPADASRCTVGDQTQFGHMSRADLEWLRDGVLDPINRVIERQTARHHRYAAYVDTHHSSRGADVCAGRWRWVEGLTAPGYPYPDNVANVLPNAFGQANTARAVLRAMHREL
ncbi:SGNH/GDSL hydrolase family protein [Streptomyces sp. SAJ15]|uniref:SGNH/GDSL hydrolase family protein n=1 Tax=Streptomyces sp. SAJ15 TaxID=2011095 RepID=UPI0011859598|nr:SGNH/GDSL hydrolase family protein [Streptomyces sp. SAJ15]TVL94286.1 hypothetical protein CD790_04740 [Streptomyces sp. SAJ15]